MRLVNLDEININMLDLENYENKDYVSGWNAVVSMIKSMPEVKIKPKSGVALYAFDGEKQEHEGRCSVCRKVIYFESKLDVKRYFNFHKYCSYCGARLEKLEDRDDN